MPTNLSTIPVWMHIGFNQKIILGRSGPVLSRTRLSRDGTVCSKREASLRAIQSGLYPGKLQQSSEAGRQSRSWYHHVLKRLVVIAKVLRIQREQHELRSIIEANRCTAVQQPRIADLPFTITIGPIYPPSECFVGADSAGCVHVSAINTLAEGRWAPRSEAADHLLALATYFTTPPTDSGAPMTKALGPMEKFHGWLASVQSEEPVHCRPATCGLSEPPNQERIGVRRRLGRGQR